MNDSFRWSCAAVGLRIKWIAFLILLVSPLVALITSLAGGQIVWGMAAMLSAALLVDVIGRLCGLATPSVRRWPILFSVTAQVSGIALSSLFVLFLADGSYGTAIGICLAVLTLVFSQVVAAYLFTAYLADVARQLGLPEWADRSMHLRSQISKSIAATSGMTSVTIMLGMLTLIGGVVTCGIGFYFLLPLDALVILGFMPLWVPILWQMLGEYGQIISHLHICIRARSTSPFKIDDDKLVRLPKEGPAE